MLKYSTTIERDKIKAIAIGGFDGLHRAHQHLLSQLEEDSAVLVIEKNFTEALTPQMHRCRYTSFPCLFLDFMKIRDMEAEEFALYVKKLFPALQKIVVGYDFRFGKGRRGDASVLGRLPGVKVIVVTEQKVGEVSIHAGEIKNLLMHGEITLANRLLGRVYSISGKVVSGQGLGKKVLYPTFNLDTGNFFLPEEGVYITRAKIGDQEYDALTFIGKRYSTDNMFSVETHILHAEFFESVQHIELMFYKYLRQNRKFEKLDHLKKQISEDIETAKNYFSKAI